MAFDAETGTFIIGGKEFEYTQLAGGGGEYPILLEDLIGRVRVEAETSANLEHALHIAMQISEAQRSDALVEATLNQVRGIRATIRPKVDPPVAEDFDDDDDGLGDPGRATA